MPEITSENRLSLLQHNCTRNFSSQGVQFEIDNGIYYLHFNIDSSIYFLQSEKELFPLRGGVDGKSLSVDEYVHMMGDVLRMRRNLCLCRHFHLLDRTAIRSNVYRLVIIQK